jgi:type VI protein secretion system component VasF
MWVFDLIEQLLDQVTKASKERKKLRAARAKDDRSAVVESRARITSTWIIFVVLVAVLATFLYIEHVTTQ